MTTINDDFGPRFRQEQREREGFLRNTRKPAPATITEEIEAAIADAGGSVHDALNVTLARLDAANALLKAEQEHGAVLSDALETIRILFGVGFSPTTMLKIVDKIVHGSLGVAGEIATLMTEED